MTMKVTRENFSLLKVKIHNGEVEVGKTENASNNGVVTHGTGRITYTSEPHPDLTRAIGNMTEYLRRVYPFLPEYLPKINANGIALSGMGANKGVIILGTYETPSGRKTALNSDRIPFEGSAYGWEDELAELAYNIENEVYAYTEEGKRAQLEIIFPDNENVTQDPGIFDITPDPLELAQTNEIPEPEFSIAAEDMPRFDSDPQDVAESGFEPEVKPKRSHKKKE